MPQRSRSRAWRHYSRPSSPRRQHTTSSEHHHKPVQRSQSQHRSPPQTQKQTHTQSPPSNQKSWMGFPSWVLPGFLGFALGRSTSHHNEGGYVGTHSDRSSYDTRVDQCDMAWRGVEECEEKGDKDCDDLYENYWLCRQYNKI